MFKKILVPVDGSQTSWKALDTARSLAEKYDGRLLVITVMIPYGSGSFLQMSLDQTLIDQNNAAMKKAGFATLDMAKDKLGSYAGDVEYLEETGNPAELILDACKEKGCDTIVIGSRGLSGVEEFLLGSVSSKVSQYAKVPVVVVK
ncbi:universal stress protein [Acidaminococcus fermentans]|uniref:UspA domain protein n=2 Tax=Acidaminococcus fermentans TaxID=905 RepID=D2RID8_ACIFV|nr:universal stress protein [Acidaminococcus fermentans]ADB46840.1 UspA domain protein [Acidaminococcus fermentans DSM 20731]MCF0138898.1 universal stress protein [Acidaminococcus fermentans]MCI6286964.1 universal stress protein [Acidaminococcus fermentans]MCI7195567.1 universal stress protein [Acidaminococcus fermentans]MDD6287274.1 universal stress protein [Acidaminococcus fermentans]